MVGWLVYLQTHSLAHWMMLQLNSITEFLRACFQETPLEFFNVRYPVNDN